MSDAEPRSPAATPPPPLSATAIIARLEAERARLGGGVLATDADGTLWDGDVGIESFEALLARGGVREAARAALEAEAAAFHLPVDSASPTALAQSLYAAYKADRYPHDRAFGMMAWSFAGWHVEELRAFAEEVLDKGRLDARIRPEMQHILRWAAGRGVPAYVVSASARGVIQVGVGRLGVPVTGALGMTPAVSAEHVLLPHLAGPLVYGEGKVRALADAGVHAPVLGAFGDSAYDAALLRAAHLAVAVTPSPGLLAVASTVPGLVQLARGAER